MTHFTDGRWINSRLICSLTLLFTMVGAMNANAQMAPTAPQSDTIVLPYWQTESSAEHANPHDLIFRVNYQAPATRQAQSPRQTPRQTQPPRTARTPDRRQSTTAAVDAHPLVPVIEKLEAAKQILEKINDYTYVFNKRERVDGTLSKLQTLEMKLRHEPFSVYVSYLAPSDVKGREAIYVEGKNNNKLLGHATGFQKHLVGTIALDPAGSWAMQGNLHPITYAGMLNMNNGLLERCKQETQYGESDVKKFSGAKVDGRPCTCYQIVHPHPRKQFKYHIVRIYFDDAWNIPTRTEDYLWPERKGADPPLLGEYTYTKLRFNVGLKDIDFDPKNPNYDYP